MINLRDYETAHTIIQRRISLFEKRRREATQASAELQQEFSDELARLYQMRERLETRTIDSIERALEGPTPEDVD